MVSEFPPLSLALSSAPLPGQVPRSWFLHTNNRVWWVTSAGAAEARLLHAVSSGPVICDDGIGCHAAVRAQLTDRATLQAAGGSTETLAIKEISICTVPDADMGADAAGRHLRIVGAPNKEWPVLHWPIARAGRQDTP